MRVPCPQWERELAVFDHLAEGRWRHLDRGQFMTACRHSLHEFWAAGII
jgi:hypothetical protein